MCSAVADTSLNGARSIAIGFFRVRQILSAALPEVIHGFNSSLNCAETNTLVRSLDWLGTPRGLRAGLFVIRDVPGQDATQSAFAQDDHVVEALAPYRSD